MKKLFGLFFAFIAILTMVACGSETGDDSSTTSVTKLEAPVITLTENVVSWDAVENAGGYVVKINDTVCDEQTETSYTVIGVSAGSYEIKVKAMPSDTELYEESSYSESVIYTKAALTATTVYFVGDSTVCEYDEKRFYQRYGWGSNATFGTYFDTNYVTIKDLALSGRSSKSFITEDNYATLKTSIKTGDYLFIGFGHNDEKTDDSVRGTYANLAITDKTSFQYYLYTYYVKLALDAGATPILCTPITRLDKTDSYTGSIIHQTDDGDYAQAIIDLGEAYDVEVVDLTTLTSTLWKTLGYEEARKFHSVTSGNSQTEPNWGSVDATHINIYGAKMVDYLIAKQLMSDNHDFAEYVKSGIVEPTEANDLVVDTDYVYVPYSANDWTAYEPAFMFETITDGWYGTAFGDCGGTPNSEGNDGSTNTNGYVATETSSGTFMVGQYSGKTDSDSESTIGYASSTAYKGKISSASQGFAFLFTPVSTSKNFTITAEFTVYAQGGYTADGTCVDSMKQDGFGLMVSDTAWVPTNDSGICDDCLTASLMDNGSGSCKANWARTSSTLTTPASASYNITVGQTGTASITRAGQIWTCTIQITGKDAITTTYTDYYYNTRDTDLCYVGMFGARGCVATWSNVSLTITGDAGEA